MANTKRRRLGDLLSPKPSAETSANSTLQQQPRAPESAPANAASRRSTHITPIQNTGQVPNVGVQRNLAVNENTGEVIDDETGEVLTVTTTTTTVTKTETRRSASPLPPPQNGGTTMTQVQSAPQTNQQQLHPAHALQPPHDPWQHRDSHAPQQQRSFEMDATQRPDDAINSQPPMLPPRSAKENLKMAAIGMQDARNTIKGTLNEGGLPIPRRNPARSSRFPSTQPPLPITHQNAQYTQPGRPVPPVPSQAPGKSQWQAPWPDPPSSNEDLGLKKRKSLSSMPQSFSPESSGQLGREKSPRLFKRSKGRKGFL